MEGVRGLAVADVDRVLYMAWVAATCFRGIYSMIARPHVFHVSDAALGGVVEVARKALALGIAWAISGAMCEAVQDLQQKGARGNSDAVLQRSKGDIREPVRNKGDIGVYGRGMEASSQRFI